MRPFGRPPMPSAMSSDGEPVEITAISRSRCSCPMTMMEPLPNCFSIDATVRSTAFCFSSLPPVCARDMRSPLGLWGEFVVGNALSRAEREVGEGDESSAAGGETALVEYDLGDGPVDRFRRRQALKLQSHRLR